MRTTKMRWNDDIQVLADRFVETIAKKIGCSAVPDVNSSLTVREDDGIGGLVNNQPEHFQAVIAA
jgi:hypothetical protein